MMSGSGPTVFGLFDDEEYCKRKRTKHEKLTSCQTGVSDICIQ